MSPSALNARNDQRRESVQEHAGTMGVGQRCPPLIGFLAREHARIAGARDVTTEKKLEKRVMNEDDLRLHRDLLHPVRLEETWQLSGDPSVLNSVAERLCDLARRFLLRRVTKLRLPIKVENRHAPAPLEDPGHLGQCKLGIWDVHQHALRANRVERICIEAEGLRIANRETHGQPTTLGSPARLVNHRPAYVYPEYMAVPSDQLRNLEHVGAHSATEV